jgi:AraC-type DNA-binding domain-containing proteins
MKKTPTPASHTVRLKVKPYQYTIIYTKNCIFRIKEEKKHEEITIQKGGIVFIEKNLNIKINIIKDCNEDRYEVHSLSNETVRRLLDVLTPVMCFPAERTAGNRNLHDKIHSIPGTEVNRELFHSVKHTKEEKKVNIYELAYLISKVDNPAAIYTSLCISASQFFSDRVRDIISSDTSKKWRLANLSEELNLSEVAVRKKLETESTNFNQLLLDIRMQKAARLILDENYHVNKVSLMVGMSSSSYFIKTFSTYYGITPKQFYLHYKTSK